jgi:hypothetical protein
MVLLHLKVSGGEVRESEARAAASRSRSEGGLRCQSVLMLAPCTVWRNAQRVVFSCMRLGFQPGLGSAAVSQAHPADTPRLPNCSTPPHRRTAAPPHRHTAAPLNPELRVGPVPL